jgi:hypothetical protein
MTKRIGWVGAVALAALAGCSEPLAGEWEAQNDIVPLDAKFDLTVEDDGTGEFSIASEWSCWDSVAAMSYDVNTTYKGGLEWEEADNDGGYTVSFRCKAAKGGCSDSPAECPAKFEGECDLSEDGEKLSCVLEDPDDGDIDYDPMIWTRSGE